MPCHAALVQKILTLSPEMEIEKALEEMKNRDLECVPVVGPDGVLEGAFSIQGLMRNLLPVSVATADGLHLDITVRAAPGVAKRLKKVLPLPVRDLMDRTVAVVYPQTPLWEGLNVLLMQQGAPVFVVEGENRRFIGMMTAASAMAELKRMHDGGEP